MPRKSNYTKRKQKAGGYNLPLEYFGQDSNKYYETGHPSNSPPSHLKAVSFGISDSVKNHTGPNLDAYHHKLNDTFVAKQKGGFSPYEKIVNPATNRKVGIHTTLGRKILKNYLSQYH